MRRHEVLFPLLLVALGAPASARPEEPFLEATSAGAHEVEYAACTTVGSTLCLGGGRFQVTAQWTTPDGRTGSGQAAALTNDTGTFWFFDPANVEVIVKVLDGCFPPFNSFWVFSAGLTNVEVALTVTDTVSGLARTYRNPQGAAFQPIQDTSAFATCAATGCTYTVSPLSLSFPATGGIAGVNVTTQAGCAWTAGLGPSWVGIVGTSTSFTGSGSVSYVAGANDSTSPRSGSVTVAGRAVSMSQPGAPSGGTYAGTFTGTTSQGRPFSFTVVGNGISTLSYGYGATGVGCTISGTRTTTYGTPAPFSGSSFSLSTSTGAGVNPSFSGTISGSFTSPTEAVGTISLAVQQSAPLPPCGGSFTATWSALRAP
ncbi:MAG: BACON domain-containing protein [Acidobacteria bacterium]|nr:BACON domain-containing protein [Acidobacteriota bacterium]